MPTALVVNPEPRHMAKTRKRRRRHARRAVARNPKRRRTRARHRKNIVVANPKARRHRKRHRRNALVLNPLLQGNPGGGIKAVGKNLLMTGLPAFGGGFLANFVDGKLLGNMGAIPRVLAKVGMGVGIGLIGGKFAPAASAAAMAGVFGSIGGDFGARAAGGLPSIPAQKATKAGLAAMAAEDEQIGSLLQGMGLIIQGMGDGEGEGYGDGDGDGTDGMGADEMAPGMAAYTDADPSAYTGIAGGGYGDMEID